MRVEELACLERVEREADWLSILLQSVQLICCNRYVFVGYRSVER
jgi:hypothetical protein